MCAARSAPKHVGFYHKDVVADDGLHQPDM